jgi:prepilin-type N-terminal cleavage/methylation domain-containing protein
MATRNKGRDFGFRSEAGFSMIELIVSMALTLIILGIAVAAFSGALGSREREISRTDALTSAQAALNIMSREIGNAGYGLRTNGIVVADSNANQLHFRTNIDNTGDSSATTDQPGEDVTFYFHEDDSVLHKGSVVRFDRVTATSGIINRVSDVDFVYYNYTYDPVTNTTTVAAGLPSANTGRVNITLKVFLKDVQGQPSNSIVTLSSDVTLRNSPYMLGQY